MAQEQHGEVDKLVELEIIKKNFIDMSVRQAKREAHALMHEGPKALGERNVTNLGRHGYCFQDVPFNLLEKYSLDRWEIHDIICTARSAAEEIRESLLKFSSE